jgi:hypothetical protein
MDGCPPSAPPKIISVIKCALPFQSGNYVLSAFNQLFGSRYQGLFGDHHGHTPLRPSASPPDEDRIAEMAAKITMYCEIFR